MVLVLATIYRESMMNINTQIIKLSLATLLGMSALSSCTWYETPRVESDFGVSVRQMVAAQIYDPKAASEPSLFGPDAHTGDAANIAVEAYLRASAQARVQRSRTSGSPIPIVGTATTAGE